MNASEPIFTPEEWQRLKRLRRIVIMGAGIVGLLVCLGLIFSFFLSAPKPYEDSGHRLGVSDTKCLTCHEFGQGGTLMPHRPFPGCQMCHRPRK